MKFKLFIPLLGMLLALSACNSANILSLVTPIGDIQENIGEYMDEKVTIRGEVVESVNLYIFKYYRVNDETGTITIKTGDSVPKVGQMVKVKGHVKQILAIDTDQLLVIEELDRKVWEAEEVEL